MKNGILERVRSVSPWHVVWLAVLASEILTLLLNVIQSRVLGIPLSRDVLLMGAVDAFVVPSIAAVVAIPVLKNLFDVSRITTSLRNAEQMREHAEERTRMLTQALDRLSVGITIQGVDGKILYVNAAEAAMHGYTVEEMLGSETHRLAPPALRKAFSADDLKTMKPWDRETVNMKRSGEVFPVRLTSSPLVDVNGTPMGMVTACEDITERRKMRDALVSAKEEWEETFNLISEAITIHDRDFHVVRANRAAETLLNAPLIEILSQRCFTSYHGLGSPPAACPSCACMKNGIAAESEIYEPHLGKHLEIRAIPRVDRFGTVVGVIHVVRDVSSRRKAEEDREKLKGELLQAQKMDSIGRLAGGIAHDFNNILSAIIGYSDLALLKLPSESPARGHVSVIKESGARAAELTRQLLAFSRKQILRMEVVDLNRIISSMAKMLHRIIGEDVRLELQLDEGMRPISADAGQVEQVLMNLVVNARDAMPSGGVIRIVTHGEKIYADSNHPYLPEGFYSAVSVSDSGTGIAPEMREKIFEPFFTTKERGKGTGLGLATVYGIVRQHNGHIEVQSEPGQGAVFTIFFPAEMTGVSVEKVPQPLTLPGGSETVLVVEDDLLTRSVVLDILAPLGYRVLSAASPDEAIGTMKAFGAGVQLLLTDVIMPGMNGKELAQVLCMQYPDLRVIFMSGYEEDIIAPHGVLKKGVHFLQKPVQPVSLAGMVRSALDDR